MGFFKQALRPHLVTDVFEVQDEDGVMRLEITIDANRLSQTTLDEINQTVNSVVQNSVATGLEGPVAQISALAHLLSSLSIQWRNADEKPGDAPEPPPTPEFLRALPIPMLSDIASFVMKMAVPKKKTG
jgi:hypothetical protein